MLRLLFSGCLGASLVLASAPASAGASGASFGVRTGWGFPIGSLESGDDLSTNLTGMIPIWLDGGYRVNEALYLGGYFQFGFAFVGSEVCPAPLACSATDLRLGLNLHWHFKKLFDWDAFGASLDPWLGIGAGYESAIIRLHANDVRSHQTNHGFEFGNVQLGADYVGVPAWRLGAFASLSLAEFAWRTASVPTGSSDHVIPQPAVHLWLMLGLRAQYDL